MWVLLFIIVKMNTKQTYILTVAIESLKNIYSGHLFFEIA